MQLKTLPQYIEFYRSLAAAHKSIRHTTNAPKFFDNIDLYQASSSVEGKHMVLGWAESSFIDQKSDNVFKLMSVELWILENCPTNDQVNQWRIYAETEQICIDINAYLRHLEHEPNYSIKPFHAFDVHGSKMEPIGPIGTGNAYGTALRLTLGNPEHLDHDTSKWDFN